MVRRNPIFIGPLFPVVYESAIPDRIWSVWACMKRLIALGFLTLTTFAQAPPQFFEAAEIRINNSGETDYSSDF